MKHIIIFLPFGITILLFLELFGGIKIPYISLLEPIRFFLGNLSEHSNFTIFGYSLLGFFVSIFGICLYAIFLVKYTKFSMLFPYVYYFGSNNNNRIFLKKKFQNLNGKNIFEIFSFYFFAFKIITNKNFSLSDEILAICELPKNMSKKMEKLNVILKRHIGKENFVKNVEFQENEYIKFFINKAELTSDEVIKKFSHISHEIETFFCTKNFEAGIQIYSKNFSEIEVLLFNKKTLWENKNLDFAHFSLQKGELLLGFYQKIANGVKNLDYTIFSRHLNHAIISASSRSGKDIILSNIIISLLWNIKKYSNYEIHFFDTKGVDGAYLENMRSYGVYRYKNIADYSQILENILQEMRENSQKIEEYSNIYTYNEKHPNTLMKEKFIVINEFLSLNNSLSAKDLNRFLNTIVSLTSEGAGFGYKVIIMSQTMRKDSSTALSSILANIKTRFILKSFQQDEVRINTRGLSDEDFMRIANMKLYNCFHIEDNEIKQEFKAYYLTQEDVKNWITKNFEITKSNNFSDKIQDYYNFAQNNEGISLKEATEKFHFTRTDWDKFVKVLEENKEIERLPNNAIVWRK